jgi:hypothetical protein
VPNGRSARPRAQAATLPACRVPAQAPAKQSALIRAVQASWLYAEKWNGAKWAVQATPNPADAGNSLGDVSCVGTSACEAVGLDSSRNGTLAERWNGTKWTTRATPASWGRGDCFDGSVGLATTR